MSCDVSKVLKSTLYFFVPPKLNFARFPTYLNLPYLVKLTSKAMLNKKNAAIRNTTPEKVREVLWIDKLIKEIQDGTFKIQFYLEYEETGNLVDFLHPQLVANNTALLNGEFFRKCFSPYEIHTIVKANVYNGTLYYNFNDFVGFLVYGFLGHYFYNSFGRCRRIDTTLLKVTDPITRSRIRSENREHPHLEQIYFTKNFDLKKFIFMASENLFQMSSLCYNPWGNPIHISVLHLMEATFAYGFFDVSDVPSIIRALTNISSSINNQEEKEFKDRASDSYHVLCRQYFLYLVIHTIALVNDHAVYKAYGGLFDQKLQKLMTSLKLSSDGQLSGTVFDKGEEILLPLIQCCFEFPMGAHVLEYLHPSHVKIFTNDVICYYYNNPADSYSYGLKLINQELVNETPVSFVQYEKAHSLIDKFNNELLIKLILDDLNSAKEPQTAEKSRDEIFKELFAELEAFDPYVLAKCTTISEYLIWLLAYLAMFELKNQTEPVFGLLKKVVVLDSTCASLMFSLPSLQNFKGVATAYLEETLEVIRIISDKFGSEFLFNQPELPDWLFSTFNIKIFFAIQNEDSNRDVNSYNAFIPFCSILIDVLSASARGNFYEEVCSQIQDKIVKFFMEQPWKDLWQESSYQNYSIEWEEENPKKVRTDKIFNWITLLRLLVSSTRGIMTEETSKAFEKISIPTLISQSFLFKEPKYFAVLADMLRLMKNVSLFKLNTYSGINIGEIVTKEMLNNMDRSFNESSGVPKYTVAEAIDLLTSVIRKSGSYVEFFKTLSPGLCKSFKKRSEYIVLTSIILVLKGLLVSSFFQSRPKEKMDILMAQVDELLGVISEFWENLGEFFDPDPEAIKSKYEVLKLPEKLEIDSELLDTKEKDNDHILRLRLKVSHALGFLKALLTKNRKAMKEIHRKYPNSFKKLASQFPNAALPFSVTKREKSKRQNQLLQSYIESKKNSFSEESTPPIINGWRKTFGGTFKVAIIHYLFNSLNEATHAQKKPNWFYSGDIYIQMEIINFCLSRMSELKEHVFEKQYLMVEAGVLGPAPVVDINPEFNDEQYDEGGTILKRAPRVEDSTPMLVLDRLHQLHICYFYRVMYKHFHNNIYDYWRARYEMISNLFQNLCEQNYQKFKILFGMRKCPGSDFPMSREIQKIYNSLIRDDVQKIGESSTLWQITSTKEGDLEPMDRPELLPQIIRTLEFLTELIVGSCKINQTLMYKYNYYMCSKTYHRNYKNPDSVGWTLNSTILTYLVAMLTSQNKQIQEYISQLQDLPDDMETIVLQLKKAYVHLFRKGKPLPPQKILTSEMLKEAYLSSEDFSENPMVQCSLKLFEILNILSNKSFRIRRFLKDYEDMFKNKKGNKALTDRKTMEEVEVYGFIRSVYRTIEIMFPENEEGDSNETKLALNKVYFQRTVKFSHLTSKSIEKFFREVDLEDRQSKFISFFEKAQVFWIEMNENEKAQKRNPILYAIFTPSRFVVFRSLNFALGIIINFFVGISFSWVPDLNDAEQDVFQARYNWARSLIFVLVIVSLALNFIFLVGWIVVVLKTTYSVEKYEYLEARVQMKKKLRLLDFFYVLFFKSFLSQTDIQGFILAIISNVLFIFLRTPLSLVIQLREIISFSPTARYVIKAITENGRQLLITAIIGLFIVYFYALITSEFLRFQMEGSDSILLKEADGDFTLLSDQDDFCEILFPCFLLILNMGTRNSGVASVMKFMGYEGTEWIYIGRFLLDISFFILINVIILNIVFGIIIDTFAEMRDTSQQRGTPFSH